MSRYYDDEMEGPGRWFRRLFGTLALVAILAFVASAYVRSNAAARGAEPPTAAGAAPEVATSSARAERSPASVPSPTTVPATVAATSPATVPATVPETTAATVTASTAPAYATGPDGSPLPVLVVYGTTTVTLTGAVPSEAARERLVALAAANSQQPVNVVDDLEIDEHVPAGVGIRVIELESPRFPDGSAELLPEHARQFDRVAAVMRALPHVSVLVIGHADQRGDATTNWELSDARARAVVAYLAAAGIEPGRLSSRAAGETDLLTVDDDATALALNRRTEFVFAGVLLD